METESGGTRRRTGGEVKGKEANGVGSQAVFSFTRNSPSSVRAEMECDGTRKRTGGEVRGKKANGGGSQQSCPVSDTVYPALLPLMRILRLLAAD